jgi:hypothetical protein
MGLLTDDMITVHRVVGSTNSGSTEWPVPFFVGQSSLSTSQDFLQWIKAIRRANRRVREIGKRMMFRMLWTLFV